jgi:hypothetical protein
MLACVAFVAILYFMDGGNVVASQAPSPSTDPVLTMQYANTVSLINLNSVLLPGILFAVLGLVVVMVVFKGGNA